MYGAGSIANAKLEAKAPAKKAKSTTKAPVAEESVATDLVQPNKGLLLPVATAAAIDSYPLQFIESFLPETILIVILSVVLTFMAVELGQGRSKRELALESLAAFRRGLSFVIALYLIQFCLEDNTALFNGYFVVSTYVTALKMLTAFSGRFILSNSETYVNGHSRHLLEYPLVLTLAVLFMLLLVGSGHLISAFLTLVGFSLNLYVLVLFDATAAVAREAGIKYFYLSTISSGLILYSLFLLFLVTGTNHIFEIGQILASQTELLLAAADLLQLAVTLLLVGIFFKLSAFPGHLWAADVYEGSPDPITAFFMLPVKVAVLAFLTQLLATGFEPLTAYWQPLLTVSAVFSLVWGCIAALGEKKTKRFLAYASINQIGFLLIGLSSASLEGYRTTMFYLILYTVMNVGFLLAFLNARRVKDGKSLLYLTDFRGFGQKNKNYSWPMAMILLSMAGIPPLAGFFGKYYLLLHAQEQGLYGLVIVGLATSLISTFYYLRIIKIMWFEGRLKQTEVYYNLSSHQTITLRAVEFTLWSLIVLSGPLTAYLAGAVESLLIEENTFLLTAYLFCTRKSAN